jgi:hypothetical protein
MQIQTTGYDGDSSLACVILSSQEKINLLKLAKKYDNFPFHNQMLSSNKEFNNIVHDILDDKTILAVKSLATGESVSVLLIKNLPVDYHLDSVQFNEISKSKVSETILSALVTLIGGVLQSEESSHQPHLIQQIKPVSTYHDERSGRGIEPLPFHVENAFTMIPPTILALNCIQGEAGIITEYISIQAVLEFLSTDAVSVLQKPIYSVKSGDVFHYRMLEHVPLIETIGSDWVLARFYEEDRIDSYLSEGLSAIDELRDAIYVAKHNFTYGVELQAGECIMFLNGFARGRAGGVMHGRKGKICGSSVGGITSRWLQRICVELPMCENKVAVNEG